MSEEQAEYKSKRTNSTVAVSAETQTRLERFCKVNGMTKMDFISLSLDYFERWGINPGKHETPAKEMEKVTKRLDQFFKFLKKQETDMLRPMVETVSLLERRVSGEMDMLRPVFKAAKDREEELTQRGDKIAEALRTALANSKAHNEEILRILQSKI